MVRETRLSLDSLIYPLFVVPGARCASAVESMPGVFQLSVDETAKEAQAVAASGVPAVLLFAAPDAQGREGERRARSRRASCRRRSPPSRTRVPEAARVG